MTTNRPIILTTARRQNTPNQFRIIAGEWRSRNLPFADVEDIRPTTDRVRETLFNWLQNEIIGANCLDLFAGSGALSFEALSRGAQAVTTVELSNEAARVIAANCKLLHCNNLNLIRADALDWLSTRPQQKYDLVFLDPPFASKFLQPCCDLLEQNHWLNPGAFIYLESNCSLQELQLPAMWRLHKEKKAGQVFYAAFWKEESAGN